MAAVVPPAPANELQGYLLRLCDRATLTAPLREDVMTNLDGEFAQNGAIGLVPSVYTTECEDALHTGLQAYWVSFKIPMEVPRQNTYLRRIMTSMLAHQESAEATVRLFYASTAGIMTQLEIIGIRVLARKDHRQATGLDVTVAMSRQERQTLVGDALSEFVMQCTGVGLPAGAIRGHVNDVFSTMLHEECVEAANGHGYRPSDNLRHTQWAMLTRAARAYLNSNGTEDLKEEIAAELRVDQYLRGRIAPNYAWHSGRMANTVFRNAYDKTRF
ncbi:MAG: hypothetical protein SGARI_002836 [Bacillariaceae sp.]